MAATKNDAEARRKAEQKEPIQTRGLETPDLPKNVVFNEMKSRIKRGVWKPGEQVPSITALMEQASVAKNTARAALDMLRDAGYLKTMTGFGTFVRPMADWDTTPEQRGE